MALVLIAAVAHDGVIGGDNRLLWHLPEDMKHFRTATDGAPVVLGRTTRGSLPDRARPLPAPGAPGTRAPKPWPSLLDRFRPLPGRHNIVLSRQPGFLPAGATVVGGLDQALAKAGAAPRVYVIGGEQVYREALPLADELLLTEIDQAFAGDAHFPDFSGEAFTEVDRQPHHAAAPNDFGFAFVTYLRQRRARRQPCGWRPPCPVRSHSGAMTSRRTALKLARLNVNSGWKGRRLRRVVVSAGRLQPYRGVGRLHGCLHGLRTRWCAVARRCRERRRIRAFRRPQDG